MRTLTVSFGGGQHQAKIKRVEQFSWEVLAARLTQQPAPSPEQAAPGWYCPATFNTEYRASDALVSRDCITFDFDDPPSDILARINEAWGSLAYAVYSDVDHTPAKPHYHVVMPLSRSATSDEFQAVARRIASDVDIELVARKSFVPAEFTDRPEFRDGAEHIGKVNNGDWLNVDSTLAEYTDWKDRSSWPRRGENDDVNDSKEEPSTEPKPQRPHFYVESADDFSEGPPLEWMVKGVISRDGTAMIYGESQSGKSFLTFDLVSCITQGIPWRGKRVKKGRVAYVVAEGKAGFRTRIKAYRKYHDVPRGVLPGVIHDPLNLLEEEQVAALAKQIVEYGKRTAAPDDTGRVVDMIVLDTLNKTTPGADENSGVDMGKMLEHCDWLGRHLGATVLLVHHSGKDSSRGARGWSGMRAAVETVIEVSREGELRTAIVSKQKDGQDGERFPFKLQRVVVGTDEDGDDITSCVVEHLGAEAVSAAEDKQIYRQRPTGRFEPLVFDVLKRMAAISSVPEADLLDVCAPKFAREEDGRDRRRRNAKRALDGLVSKKLAFIRDGRVSCAGVTPVGKQANLDLEDDE